MQISAFNRILLVVSLLSYGWLMVLVITPKTEAHSKNNSFFNTKPWKLPQTVTYRPTPSVPSSALTAISRGASAWNGLSPLSLRVSTTRLPRDFYYSTCASRDWLGIHFYRLPTGVMGRHHRCVNSAGLTYSSQVVFNKDVRWYTGTGSPTAYDLWSVATHEFGHAAGLGHWTGSSLCPRSSRIHSMCQGSTYRRDYKRSPELHDRHTFQSAY